MSHYTRQNYVDLDYPLRELPIGFKADFYQPKYDGIWAAAVYESGDYATVYSRTGVPKAQIFVPPVARRFGAFVAIGEYLVGQSRAVASEDYGKLYAFDLISLDNHDLRFWSYKTRYTKLRDLLASQVDGTTPWLLVPCYSMSSLPEFWTRHVAPIGAAYEGIVYRSWDSPWSDTLYRSKAVFTVDLIVDGFMPGEAGGKYAHTLGSLVLRYANSDLRILCAGMSDDQRIAIWAEPERFLGRVVEVSCFGVFPSGSLRHPQFVRFRDDKLPQQCLVPIRVST